MKFLKFFQYAYLAFVVLFVCDSIVHWNADGNRVYMSLAFAGLALFMFFFKRKYTKRFHDRGKL
ncbi:MAG: hypothetical protein HRT67_11225 [Flavobacteriaceae bacterium]|nr:hypothetical protein [Flavobacteriaceae bacterium]